MQRAKFWRPKPRKEVAVAQHNLAFVTGATGFVGAAVARALAARGFALRLLVQLVQSGERQLDLLN